MRITYENKLIDPSNISQISEDLRPLVFTNGVFDIIHRGHISYLRESQSLGKSLLVALNSDDSTRKLNKGKDRPINNLEDRMSVVSALEAVDFVTWFDEDNPILLIKSCKPNVLVKGGDWAVDNIVGSDIVKREGGQVVSIPFAYDRSTTEILKKIRGKNTS